MIAKTRIIVRAKRTHGSRHPTSPPEQTGHGITAMPPSPRPPLPIAAGRQQQQPHTPGAPPYSHKLEGPVRLAEYVGRGRHIYLIGDTHQKESTCSDQADAMQLIPFIYTLFADAGIHTVDFFIEQLYAVPVAKNVAETGSYITDVLDYFRACFARRKESSSQCPWLSHVCFHSGDIRNIARFDANLVASAPPPPPSSSSLRSREYKSSSQSVAPLLSMPAYLANTLSADQANEEPSLVWALSALSHHIRERTSLADHDTWEPVAANDTSVVFIETAIKRMLDDFKRAYAISNPSLADIRAALVTPGPTAAALIGKQLKQIEDPSVGVTIQSTLSPLFVDYAALARFLHENTPIYLFNAKVRAEALQQQNLFVSSLYKKLLGETNGSAAADDGKTKPPPPPPVLRSYIINPRVLVTSGHALFLNEALAMDTYVMTRVFRKWAQHRGPGPTDAIRRVVIYAGDAHAANYAKVFDALGLRKLAEDLSDTESSMQCITLTKFRRPYFSFTDVELDSTLRKEITRK